MPVYFNTPEMIARARVGVARGILAATEDVRNEVLRLILTTPKSGRLYRRRGVVHQASAPDEPPASDIGTLVSRITTEYREDGLLGVVASRAAHAAHLEYGTARMAARPHMRLALANKREETQATINRAIVNAALGA